MSYSYDRQAAGLIKEPDPSDEAAYIKWQKKSDQFYDGALATAEDILKTVKRLSLKDGPTVPKQIAEEVGEFDRLMGQIAKYLKVGMLEYDKSALDRLDQISRALGHY